MKSIYYRSHIIQILGTWVSYMVFNGGERVIYVGYKPICSNGIVMIQRGQLGTVMTRRNNNLENDIFSLVPVSFDNNIICLEVSSLTLRHETLSEKDDFRTIFNRFPNIT